jgi:hypothetical protein
MVATVPELAPRARGFESPGGSNLHAGGRVWADTAQVSNHIERHHWVNTIIGFLDATWHLTDIELVQVSRIIGGVLDILHIPDRGEPAEIPIPLMMEVGAGFYSRSMAASADAATPRPVRELAQGDVSFSPDIWRAAVAGLFTAAYPDLDGVERLYLDKTIADLLTALGVDRRAPQFVSEDVARIASQRS